MRHPSFEAVIASEKALNMAEVQALTAENDLFAARSQINKQGSRPLRAQQTRISELERGLAKARQLKFTHARIVGTQRQLLNEVFGPRSHRSGSWSEIKKLHEAATALHHYGPTDPVEVHHLGFTCDVGCGSCRRYGIPTCRILPGVKSCACCLDKGVACTPANSTVNYEAFYNSLDLKENDFAQVPKYHAPLPANSSRKRPNKRRAAKKASSARLSHVHFEEDGDALNDYRSYDPEAAAWTMQRQEIRNTGNPQALDDAISTSVHNLIQPPIGTASLSTSPQAPDADGSLGPENHDSGSAASAPTLASPSSPAPVETAASRTPRRNPARTSRKAPTSYKLTVSQRSRRQREQEEDRSNPDTQVNSGVASPMVEVTTAASLRFPPPPPKANSVPVSADNGIDRFSRAPTTSSLSNLSSASSSYQPSSADGHDIEAGRGRSQAPSPPEIVRRSEDGMNASEEPSVRSDSPLSSLETLADVASQKSDAFAQEHSATSVKVYRGVPTAPASLPAIPQSPDPSQLTTAPPPPADKVVKKTPWWMPQPTYQATQSQHTPAPRAQPNPKTKPSKTKKITKSATARRRSTPRKPSFRTRGKRQFDMKHVQNAPPKPVLDRLLEDVQAGRTSAWFEQDVVPNLGPVVLLTNPSPTSFKAMPTKRSPPTVPTVRFQNPETTPSQSMLARNSSVAHSDPRFIDAAGREIAQNSTQNASSWRNPESTSGNTALLSRPSTSSTSYLLPATATATATWPPRPATMQDLLPIFRNVLERCRLLYNGDDNEITILDTFDDGFQTAMASTDMFRPQAVFYQVMAKALMRLNGRAKQSVEGLGKEFDRKWNQIRKQDGM